MQIIMETDEAHSLMSVITSYIIDRSGVSQDAKAKLRKWRTDRALGTPAMDELAARMNEALGTYIDDKTARTIRRKGRYITARDRA
jgi:hypothetical protein